MSALRLALAAMVTRYGAAERAFGAASVAGDAVGEVHAARACRRRYDAVGRLADRLVAVTEHVDRVAVEAFNVGRRVERNQAQHVETDVPPETATVENRRTRLIRRVSAGDGSPGTRQARTAGIYLSEPAGRDAERERLDCLGWAEARHLKVVTVASGPRGWADLLALVGSHEIGVVLVAHRGVLPLPEGAVVVAEEPGPTGGRRARIIRRP